MSNPADTFRQEATDILEGLEENLLELEAEPDSRTLVDTVFRALHTIKGSGEMFGFSALAKFVHHFENAYDLVRSGSAVVTPELINISLNSRDHIAALLDAGQDDAQSQALVASDIHRSLLARIETFTTGGSAPAAETVEEAAEEAPARMTTYTITFHPEASALRNGMRPDFVAEELEQLGQCETVILGGNVPTLEELDASASYLGWRFRLETDAGKEKIEDIFLFFDDGDIKIEADEPEEEQAPVEQSSSTPSDTAPSPAAKAAAQPDGENAVSQVKSESVRVQAHRLDDLMDQLGELVIAQARLNRISERLGEAALSNAAEEIERLVTGMRDATLSIRMLPISGVFGKFRRVVRDLATELGKQIVLVTEGGDTELDKNIIDRLSEPLVHIVRNSADHGIESAEDRAAAGKPAEATLKMIARQTGGEVLISVTDDGGGLKTDKIRARAIDRGLISDSQEMSDDEVNQLIFAPGFSTAETVSSVSGRGVGMDAVRNFVEDLRGAVDVKSTPGNGTTVSLRLPLTLAIIDGLLIQVGDGSFVLPLSSVEECVELSAEQMDRNKSQSIVSIRDEFIPFIELCEVFSFTRSDSSVYRMVIVNTDGKRVGLMVDEIIGQHQTVIKSLSEFHKNVGGMAGCTILGDGSVALIIDPVALIKTCGARIKEAA